MSRFDAVKTGAKGYKAGWQDAEKHWLAWLEKWCKTEYDVGHHQAIKDLLSAAKKR